MPKGKFQEPLSQIYRLRRDGRRLCYALYGGKGGPGRELVYFHGWSNSLLEGRILEKEAMERRVRVISIDRPGVGESDMHWLRNGFGLESFAENVHELLTSHLNITHPPHLLSYSGGAQWLLTYRRLFLDTPRETRSAIISPTPPTHLALNRLRARLPRTTFYPVYLSTQYLPPLPLLFLNIVALRTRLGRFGPKEFASQLSNEADIRAVTAPRNREKIEYMIHGLRRAVERNFGVGWWEEGRAVMREPPAWSWVGETGRGERNPGQTGDKNWDLSVWVGEGDDRVPVGFSREEYGGGMGERFKVVKGEGHTSVLVEKTGEVLDWLLGG